MSDVALVASEAFDAISARRQIAPFSTRPASLTQDEGNQVRPLLRKALQEEGRPGCANGASCSDAAGKMPIAGAPSAATHGWSPLMRRGVLGVRPKLSLIRF